MKGFKLTRTDGFTLIELMVAVMIIGILAMLAMPRYRAVVANARMSEAKTNLSTIGKLQQAYQLRTHGRVQGGVFEGDYCCYTTSALAANGAQLATRGAVIDIRYGGLASLCADTPTEGSNPLGFRVTDCEKSRYMYQIEPVGQDTAHGGRGFNSAASGAAAKLSNPIYPNCTNETTQEIDEWGIYKNTWVLEHSNDVIANCEDG